MTSHPLTPAHSSKGGFFGSEERTLTRLFPSLPSLLFRVFHSCALTEVVYRSEFTSAVTSENAADVGVGKAGERAAAFQCWLERTGPEGGHAVPSERAASNAEMEPCERLCKGHPASRHRAERKNSRLITRRPAPPRHNRCTVAAQAQRTD